MRRLVLALSLLVTAAFPCAARASPWDVFGFGARAIGMGGAMSSLADDFTATYYNPAGLTARRKVHFGLGLQLEMSNLSIETTREDPNRTPVLPAAHTAVTLGIVFPLGGKIDYRLAFGIAINIPTNTLFRLEAIDAQTPQYFMYQSLPDKLVIAPALAGRITDWFSIGVGLQVLANLTGSGVFAADIVNRAFTDRNLEVNLDASAALTAGILLGPLQGFRFAVAYRGSLALNYHLPVKLSLTSLGDIDLDIFGTAAYTPDTITFGVSYELPSKNLRFAFDLIWARWANVPDASPKINVNGTGVVIDRLGLGQALDLVSPELPIGASNTWSPHFGVEWNMSEAWMLRGGYFFRPTPIPRQNGFTNYLDGDAHGFSVGLGWTVPDILELHKHPITIEFAFQSLYLPNRAALKPPESPVGDVQSGGSLFTLAINVRHDF